nr:hypothetical protein [Tanacetum cinerariifolium]
MIRAQVGDLSSHTTKHSSHALTQKVFANMRKVGVSTAGFAAEGDVSATDDVVPTDGRIIADMDADVDVTLKDAAAVAKDGQDAEMEESADVQGRQAESQA